jgi:hypothetical protein
MSLRKARELLAEALRLRDKFHAEHMLDKEESDKFDALLTAAAKELEADNV